jgi:hypothetical protein
MNQVPVLGELDAEQRAVGGKRAAREAALVDAPEANGFRRAVHLFGTLSVASDVEREPVEVADGGGAEPGSLREPFVQSDRTPHEEGMGFSAGERLHEPAA